MNLHFTVEQVTHRSFWNLCNRFCVPAYQRDYNWLEGDLDDLLFGFLNPSNGSNYLGEVVLLREPAQNLILYGQQKLISIHLLSWAVVQLLEEWIEAGQDISDNPKRIALIQEITGSCENPKLELNRHVNSFYQTYICRKGHPGTLTRYKPVEQTLYRFYEYFLKYLRLQITDTQKMDTLLQRVLQDTTISVIQVSDHQDAYRFLLSRQGTEADTADLFKAHLLAILEHFRSDATVKIDQSWQQLSSQLGSFSFMEFVRLYWCSSRGYVRKQLFFAIFCEQLTTPIQVLEFVQNLHQIMSEALMYLRRRLASEESDLNVAAIRILRPYPIFPLLFAAKQCIDKEEFTIVSQNLVAIAVRYLVVCRRNPHELEQVCSEIALEVRCGKFVKAYDIFQGLRKFFIPDEVFKHDFAMCTIDTRLHNDTAHWILTSLERHLNPHTTFPNAFIEHILPENPTFSWTLLFHHRTEEWIYRLGNLCLVEKNSQTDDIEQQNFEEKANEYKLSKWVSTQKIADYEDWNPTIITHHQRELAEIACQVWHGSH